MTNQPTVDRLIDDETRVKATIQNELEKLSPEMQQRIMAKLIREYGDAELRFKYAEHTESEQ